MDRRTEVGRTCACVAQQPGTDIDRVHLGIGKMARNRYGAVPDGAAHVEDPTRLEVREALEDVRDDRVAAHVADLAALPAEAVKVGGLVVDGALAHIVFPGRVEVATRHHVRVLHREVPGWLEIVIEPDAAEIGGVERGFFQRVSLPVDAIARGLPHQFLGGTHHRNPVLVGLVFAKCWSRLLQRGFAFTRKVFSDLADPWLHLAKDPALERDDELLLGGLVVVRFGHHRMWHIVLPWPVTTILQALVGTSCPQIDYSLCDTGRLAAS